MEGKGNTAEKKKLRTMDAILIFIALFLLVFVAVMILLYYRTGGIPDTLCTCVFACCGGECGVMGWIKTTKERQRDRTYELQDREYNEKMMRQQEAVEGGPYDA
ncbi:MAG: hypothetical protein Q4C52_11920 [Eubacteriales bacterium]|nr:hypothetical protein [Eubacteriales bacterium]